MVKSAQIRAQILGSNTVVVSAHIPAIAAYFLSSHIPREYDKN